ncbi:MAG TPA: hypothetical protein VKU80_17635 [Planctomycetota bacterium]|nr:hypothetical protein [Planctomycetota bacterium]
MTNQRTVQIPLPNPSEIAFVASDGAVYIVTSVDRYTLENRPAEVVPAILKHMDHGMDDMARNGQAPQDPVEPPPPVVSVDPGTGHVGFYNHNQEGSIRIQFGWGG